MDLRNNNLFSILILMTKLALCSFCIALFAAFIPTEKMAQVETISLEQLQTKMIHPENDTLYVVNFWATWCKPCIAELPFFEQAKKNNADKRVKILLISLDFLSEKEKVKLFVAKKGLQNEVYLLNAGNPNNWIDKIEKSWDGAIPATVMYKTGQQVFFKEGDLTKAELDSTITLKINQK
jgi:thiol-disulfide isomerase/thioredoxin